MADTRWIRVHGGMAGRNGYLVKIKGGYTGYFYADPEPVATFTLASEGKHFFDNPENAPTEN
ncbi:MAG TPA: hypothetical protein VMV58_01820 [Desulfosporosinus sp.]|nr:hypothetical protein [Desulfosporosinus sp.]